MLNLIFLSHNHFLNEAIINLAKNIEKTQLVHDKIITYTTTTCHIITLDDSNPIRGLIHLTTLSCFKKNDTVIILSEVVTETLARRFVAESGHLVCIKKKISVQAFEDTCVSYQKPTEKRLFKTEKLLDNLQKKLLLSINNGDSVRESSKGLRMREKEVSARRIRIMKKMGIERKFQFFKFVISQDLTKAIPFL